MRCTVNAGEVVGYMTSGSAREVSNALLLAEYRRRGDRTARDRVIEQNLPLVRAIARRFSRSPDQVDDLVQVGAIGLIKAVDGFAEDRGRDLGAYAVPTIVGELRRSVDEPAWPGRRLRRRPDVERAQVAVPFDEETLEGVGTASEVERADERLLLRAGIRSLSRRERCVIVLRYYEDWSQERIALHLGVSQPQVSRILATALRKLRHELAPEREHCAPRHT